MQGFCIVAHWGCWRSMPLMVHFWAAAVAAGVYTLVRPGLAAAACPLSLVIGQQLGMQGVRIGALRR